MSVWTRTYPATGTKALVAAGAIALVAPVVMAHHAAAPHFDQSKEVTLEATITKFELVNPHSYVYFTVPDPAGKPVQWRCEMAGRVSLQRNGWTEAAFPPGRKVTIKGAPARREANVCALESVIGADGREVKAGENLSKGVNPLATLGGANRATPRAARLANGQPNLSGLWLIVPGARGRGNGEGPNRTNYVMGSNGGVEATPAGLAAAKGYDPIYDNPSLKCEAANIFFGLGMNNHVNEITQANDAVVIKYGYMDLVRTVHLNTAVHPTNITPSRAGHSIGRFEGNTLVVDTVGFLPGVIVPQSGLMHSAAMHAVERFTVDNATGLLSRTYRGNDPRFLTSVYAGWDDLRLSDEPHTPYKCVELSGTNNVRQKP